MGHNQRPRRASSRGAMTSRSVRVDDEVWERAKRRAESEGKTVSGAIGSLLEGYSKGMIDLPRVQVVYSPPKTE